MSRQAWAYQSLADIASLEYGAALPARSRTGDEFPVFGSNGEVGRHRSALVQGPGIVVGRKGTVGALTWSDSDFWPIDTTYYVKTERTADLRWLFWMLSTLGLERLDSSTGVPGLNRNDAYELRFQLPSLPDQRRIAEILDTLDVRIRTSEQIVAKLETVKIAIIEDQLRAVEIYRQLREIADLQVGYAFSSLDFLDGDRGVRLLRGENVGYGRPDWSELRSLKSSVAARFRQYELAVDDIIIGMDRTFTKSGMRLSTITSDDLPSLLVQRVGRFIPQSVSQRYLQSVLESAAYRRSLNACQKGMDIPHLSRDEILDQLVPVAGSKVQCRVAESTSLVRNRIEAEVATSRRLRMLKAGLMDDLLTGRVRVSIDVAS